jgi:hypothetical protein
MANHLLGAPDDATGAVLREFVRKVTRSLSSRLLALCI